MFKGTIRKERSKNKKRGEKNLQMVLTINFV